METPHPPQTITALRVVLPFVCIFVYIWWMYWCIFDFLKLEYFHLTSFSVLVMSRELKLCPGVGDRKCGAFLFSLDRDPHLTFTGCRGKICIMDLTCDICVEWSSAQWEAFAKKRSYAERKRSCPSGSLPPAPKTSPCARTSSEIKHPEASSSSSLPSGGQAKRGSGVSQDAPGAASREASSLPA